ncbi:MULTISPECIES: glucose-1-phosphate adenylyltransferase [Alteromonadaceae]|jgi:glucose-1-phosphate adenylyltransferase|uniref:Glucose-1-phosphate adenylyltransferase n=1 Tax=Brumicola blandensis TaxID=3075611 RepID=A0AAW8R2E7_9ALTE|nr:MULTISPECIES: glucose-1-phosphate adenylyltransferase [unclassified Alteromonas]MDT0581323.1 glucose-1-phosphate adenylyltransferase [Alteromonas sp. W409]MDT0626951.1 glucose-1-phosphate adenylyltransferase [Alteromonas sp. W364]
MPKANNVRYISNLTKDTYALVLAGGRGSRLHELTNWRAKPALYFGGKFRIIDFPLSNCVNSGIRNIGVLTQYKSHSLIRHLVRGWGHFKKELGESVEILPASQRFSEEWYQGTADAVYQNIDIIRDELPKYVMVLSGDHIYRQDYGHILAQHVESGAKMTVSTIAVPIEQARNAFGVISIDENNKIVDFHEKPSEPTPLAGNESHCLASMGNYVFDTDFLFEQLERDSQTKGSERDFGKDIIPALIDKHDVYAFEFSKSSKNDSYWRDVGTLDSYWEANMELVAPVPALNIYDKEWPIWTYQEQLPPAKFVMESETNRGEALNSVVSGGCIVSGSTLVKTVCFSNVRVKSGSTVDQSVILPGVTIGTDCKIRKAIIDRGCVIPDNTVIGHNHDEDRARGFRVSENGVVLVTKTELGD